MRDRKTMHTIREAAAALLQQCEAPGATECRSTAAADAIAHRGLGGLT